MFKCFTKEELELIRERYPVGCRVVVHYMEDSRPIAPGTKGIVRTVDDMGTVHCNFDNGRRLGLIPGIDSFNRIFEDVEVECNAQIFRCQ